MLYWITDQTKLEKTMACPTAVDDVDNFFTKGRFSVYDILRNFIFEQISVNLINL